PALADGTAKVDRLTFSLPAAGVAASVSADATESSISLIEGSVVLFAVLPVTAELVIVYRPATLAVQKSFTWFQSRSLARKSASADDSVLSDVDALRSFEARWLDRRPGIAIAAMIAMIAITIISSINVKPFLPLRIRTLQSVSKKIPVPQITFSSA